MSQSTNNLAAYIWSLADLLRGDFKQSQYGRIAVSDSSGNTISQIITNAVDQKLIKLDPNAPDSRRYARYIPYWA